LLCAPGKLNGSAPWLTISHPKYCPNSVQNSHLNMHIAVMHRAIFFLAPPLIASRTGTKGSISLRSKMTETKEGNSSGRKPCFLLVNQRIRTPAGRSAKYGERKWMIVIKCLSFHVSFLGYPCDFMCHFVARYCVVL
jgi:hypothetical protein